MVLNTLEETQINYKPDEAMFDNDEMIRRVDAYLQADDAYNNNITDRYFREKYYSSIKDLKDCGSNIVPILHNRLFSQSAAHSDIYRFSSLLAEIGDVNNLDLALDSISDPRVFLDYDGSSCIEFITYFSKVYTYLLSNNPKDPRLDSIKQRLSGLLAFDFNNDSAKESILSLLKEIDDGEIQDNIPVSLIGLGLSSSRIETAKSDTEYTLSERACIRALEAIINQNYTATALPAIKLHLYNYFIDNSNPTPEQLAQVLRKMRILSDDELRYQHEDNPLPTIGIEVECPYVYFIRERAEEVLNTLDIPHYEEAGELLEINASFSYSPWVQGRILQELASSGIIALYDETDDGVKRVRPNDLYSLHINLGTPNGVERLHFYDVELLVDVITYGYTSQQRILGRKFNISYRVRDSGTSASTKNSDDLNIRLEIRSTEFRDFPTYRLLADTQAMGAMLFSHVKKTNNLPLSSREAGLADLWTSFSEEADTVLNQATYIRGLYDHNRERTVELMRSTDIVNNCRSLMSKYSKMVREKI